MAEKYQTSYTGYNKNAERYRERTRRDTGMRNYPNRRRRIITGKDLTTPLIRSKIIHKRVTYNMKTEKLPREKLPWGSIIKIIAVSAAVCFLILSYIVLFEIDYIINNTAAEIRSAYIETNSLERQFELENDSAEILKTAREEFGMVDEIYIQKRFIKSRNEDKAVIAEKSSNFLFDMFASVFAVFHRED